MPRKCLFLLLYRKRPFSGLALPNSFFFMRGKLSFAWRHWIVLHLGNNIVNPHIGIFKVFDLPDDMATKIAIQFYSDARDALVKAIEQ